MGNIYPQNRIPDELDKFDGYTPEAMDFEKWLNDSFDESFDGALKFAPRLIEVIGQFLAYWSCERLDQEAMRIALPPRRVSVFTRRVDRAFKYFARWCAITATMPTSSVAIVESKFIQRADALRGTLEGLLREARTRAVNLEARADSLRLEHQVGQIADLLLERERPALAGELVALLERIASSSAGAAATCSAALGELQELQKQNRALQLASNAGLEELVSHVKEEALKQGLPVEKAKSVFADVAQKAAGGVVGAGVLELAKVLAALM